MENKKEAAALGQNRSEIDPIATGNYRPRYEHHNLMKIYCVIKGRNENSDPPWVNSTPGPGVLLLKKFDPGVLRVLTIAPAQSQSVRQ